MRGEAGGARRLCLLAPPSQVQGDMTDGEGRELKVAAQNLFQAFDRPMWQMAQVHSVPNVSFGSLRASVCQIRNAAGMTSNVSTVALVIPPTIGAG